LKLLDEEEQKEVKKFYHLKDSKLSLVGRTLLNFVIYLITSIPNSKITWKRTAAGLSYDICYSGNLAVCACE
jgi:hypothetical protein